MNEAAIRHAETDVELRACFNVMRQLRPHIETADDLLAAIARQRAQGYSLLACSHGDTPLALAGYRTVDSLVHGRFLYVDDLVTDSAHRGRHYGEYLLAALRRIGVTLQCRRLVLDTALENEAAQRFYRRAGLAARALRFNCEL